MPIYTPLLEPEVIEHFGNIGFAMFERAQHMQATRPAFPVDVDDEEDIWSWKGHLPPDLEHTISQLTLA